MMTDVVSSPLDELHRRDAFDTLPQAFIEFLSLTRRHLHRHPELGLQEHETSRFIRSVLRRHGLTPSDPLAVTGLYVDIEGARPGPTVAYRADIDALPIQDAKEVAYKSQRAGVAHLCGHDVHTTIGLAVALMLDQMRDAIHGTVRVFFQPNEEGIPSGAPLMIRDGVLDGVTAAYAIHVDPTLEAGRYGLIAGPATAAATRFSFFVHGGRTGHSARPHESVDTVWIATQLAQQLYQLTGRITDARHPAVIAICRFFGSEAFNVIPETVEFGGTLRTTLPADDDRLRTHMLRMAEHASQLYDATVEVGLDLGAPSVVNDARLVDNASRTVRALYGDQALYPIPLPSMGTEDFAFYLEHVPGLLVRVGTQSGPETAHPLHDNQFDIDEAAMGPAARLMAHTLVNHLRDQVV